MCFHGFEAKLERPEGTGTWTLVRVPAQISRAFGTRARIAANCTVNAISFQASLMPDGAGGHFMVVKREVRDAAGIAAGDIVHVEISADREPRQVAIPPELAVELDADGIAVFRALSYSRQKEYVAWIESGKRSETRLARARKAVPMILAGERLR